MLTRYEPTVNLLRNTTACFSAGVGGADAVTVEAHDLEVDPSVHTDLGTRMARNTQLLLIEESQLARVLDPAGGSWYVERLTAQIADRAWSRFQEIEAAGGMVQALAHGVIQAHIDETWTARAAHLSRRTDTMVGVNDFPNLNDAMPPPVGAIVTGLSGAGEHPGLARRRYAEPFEHLRERTDEGQRTTGDRPTVLLVCLGSAAVYTARSTFAKAFFETAGLRTAEFHADADVDTNRDPDGGGPTTGLQQAIAGSQAVLACVCSSDAVYGEEAAGVLGVLGAAGLARVYVATRTGELGDAMLAAGAQELIYAGCDVLEALGRALDAAGVS